MNTPMSPRRRRLIQTGAVLGAVAILAAVGLVWRTSHQRPSGYRPDEQPDDITSELAKALPPDAPKPRLADVTQQGGLAAFRNFAGHRTSQLPEDIGPGLAWGDFDNDGDDDLLLVGAGGGMDQPEDQLPRSVLFENLGDGTFREVAGFPETRIRGTGVAWGDYDGDGYLDVVVVGYNAIRLFHNERGTGKFTRDVRLPDLKGFWSGVAWGDFDNDRRLDLHVCNYVDYATTDADRGRVSDQVGTAVPYTLNPAAFPGGRNALFHQLPDGTFTNVAAALKIENVEGRSMGAVWHDFDQDGWLDLYVANDVSDNVLFHNVGGRFEDISHPAWVADYRSAMGLAVGDFDRDGDDDLHITHWVAQENALYENMLADLNGFSAKPGVQRPAPASASASPSTNRQALRFVDIADQKGLGQIALPVVGWGTEFVDLDQDGWLDLLVANGSTIEMDGPPPKKLQPQESFLFWNRRGESFHNLAPLIEGLRTPHVSRGLACADFDGDGDMDFAIADLGEGVRLYRNDFPGGHWLKVRLRSRNAAGVANGFGEGSTAIAWLGGVPLRRSVSSVSYLSQSSHTLHWGLGASNRLDRFEVRWHAGGTNRIEGLEPDAFYEVLEGENVARRIGAAHASGAASLNVDRTATAAVPVPDGRNTSITPADKVRVVQFWARERAAMDAMKVDRDNVRAVALFREAIELNPAHEDSRYYLGLCLASQGDFAGSMEALAGLQKLNPSSHRAWQQWGVVRALCAKSALDYQAAEQALLKAQALNPEETGALLVLGEVALLRGDRLLAEDRLAAATRTNPKAVGGFFLRGYLAWKRGDATAARDLLEQSRKALGPDWQPKGTTSEGDVKHKQHVDATPLAACWESWDGGMEPATAFVKLEERLGRKAQ